ncbi:MAG: hypothetical protein U1C19_08885 [Methanobacteriaceae archaeon]|nr:hypothetical protein [Methanobacteriaceae archaeon]
MFRVVIVSDGAVGLLQLVIAIVEFEVLLIFKTAVVDNFKYCDMLT